MVFFELKHDVIKDCITASQEMEGLSNEEIQAVITACLTEIKMDFEKLYETLKK